MQRGRELLVFVIVGGLTACNYVIGYDKLKKVNRPITILPDGALVFVAATEVALGSKHTCAVIADRSLRCWGDNDVGQLGVGAVQRVLVPTSVADVADVTSVSLGDRHTCVTIANGDTLCWGANESGQLGIGAADFAHHDRPVRALASPAARVHAGRSHTCIETQM